MFGAAVGGIFSLVFAFNYGRASQLNAKALSATLALFGFVAFAIVPFVKYPPNPPAVGDGSTIGYRTALFFVTIALGLSVLWISVKVSRYLRTRFDMWSSCAVGGLVFVTLISFTLGALPTVNEVPDSFPALLLWNFRMATLGVQAILWAGLGITFGWLSNNALERYAYNNRGHVKLD